MDSKIKDLYLKRAESRIDSKVEQIKALTRTDSEGLNFVRGELEALETKLHETLFQAMKSFEFIPFAQRHDPYIDSVSYEMETVTGVAKTMHHASQDRPSVNTFLKKFTRPVLEAGASYSYDVADVGRAALLQYNQVERKAVAAAKAIARWHDRFALDGDSDAGVTGFSNYSGITPVSPVTGNWTTSTTAAQILGDLVKLMDSIPTASLDNHEANTLLLGTSAYLLARNAYFDSSYRESALTRFEATYPGCTVGRWNALDTRGDGGVSRAIAYEKSSDVLEYVPTILYDEASPDKRGYSFDVQCKGRAAGLVIYRPAAVAYMDVT